LRWGPQKRKEKTFDALLARSSGRLDRAAADADESMRMSNGLTRLRLELLALIVERASHMRLFMLIRRAGVYAPWPGYRSFDNGLSYAIEPTRGNNADNRGRPRKEALPDEVTNQILFAPTALPSSSRS